MSKINKKFSKAKRFRLGENEKEIIKQIGLGALVIASFVAPNLPIAIRQIQKIRGNKGLQALLEKLKNKNVIYLGEERIKLTTRGRELLNEIYLSEISIKQSDEWDGVWRLVAYDIPEIYKKSRDLFRKILETNGFYQIQKSLWVYPYECKQEIAVLAKKINISQYVIMMATKNLPNQKGMEDHFNLTVH